MPVSRGGGPVEVVVVVVGEGVRIVGTLVVSPVVVDGPLVVVVDVVVEVIVEVVEGEVVVGGGVVVVVVVVPVPGS